MTSVIKGHAIEKQWPLHAAAIAGVNNAGLNLQDDWMMTHEFDHMAFRPCLMISTGWKRAWQRMSNHLHA